MAFRARKVLGTFEKRAPGPFPDNIVNSVIVFFLSLIFSWQYDLSLPLPKMYDLVLDMRKKLGTRVTNVTGYGHLGDGEKRTICHL